MVNVMMLRELAARCDGKVNKELDFDFEKIIFDTESECEVL